MQQAAYLDKEMFTDQSHSQIDADDSDDDEDLLDGENDPAGGQGGDAKSKQPKGLDQQDLNAMFARSRNLRDRLKAPPKQRIMADEL